MLKKNNILLVTLFILIAFKAQGLHTPFSVVKISNTIAIKKTENSSFIYTNSTLTHAQEKQLASPINKATAPQMDGLNFIILFIIITLLSLLTLSLYKNNVIRGKANEFLKKRNKELLAAKERTEKAMAVKEEFLSNITHELRTPMYAVTGLTHLLLSESPTPNQKKHLDSLKFSGEHLLSLINNILELGKLEAKKVEVNESSFNLNERVKDVISALDNAAKLKRNTINLSIDPNIPKNLIGDPLIISQILINLIGNAIKFTEDGLIWITIAITKITEDDVDLHFTIKDNGQGISTKKQKLIFKSFTQGSAAVNKKYEGTGLGLSIVKNLLQLVGSKIQLQSSLAVGSTFTFPITYKIKKETIKSLNPQDEESEYDIENLRGKHILVVEDNKINQMITRKILEKNDLTCDIADDGEMSLDMISKQKYDLILMDIHMPGISGIEATKRIRVFNKDIPIIALTAVTLKESTDHFFEIGFNDIVPKPYKVEELFKKMHHYILTPNLK